MTKPLASRVALVTGATRGIGHATAIALAREGAHVVAIGRTPGALEELDDAIKAEGGTATLVPLDVKDTDGIVRLAGAINERYDKLDILIGNAALVGSNSPLDHFQPKEWDEVIAVNVTANWHLIRAMDALLRRSDAGRAVFLTSGAPRTRAPTAASTPPARRRSKRWPAPTPTRPHRRAVRVNLFNPGPTRTSMRAAVMPGEDPMTLPTPEEVAATIVPLCLPSFSETGKLYDFRIKRLLSFHPPA